MRSHTFLAAVVVTVVVAVFPASPASAADDFTFYGSGYGHGLGMSQWGAYGLAQDGWAHKAILTHFYSGTSVKRAADPPRAIRVGLTQGRSVVHLSAEAGPVRIRIGSKTGSIIGSIPSGRTWTVRAVGSKYRVLNSGGRRVGGRDWGGPSRNLYLTYAGARVRSAAAGATYNRGSIEFNLTACGGSDCSMRMILVIGPEAYLYGLGEVPSSWPLAAMRAQAVAARSYAFAKVASGQHRSGCNCGLYDSSLDQVYVGWNKEGGYLGDRWVRAVDRSGDQVVISGGDVITAFYTSSDGGFTENNENVWRGGTPLPYLRGVCDPGDYAAANPSRVWKVSYTASQVTDRLRPYTGSIGRVTGFSDLDRGVSGRIVNVRVNGGTGSRMISGLEFRAGLGLKDDRVWINRDKNVTGQIRTIYDAADCGPGLPATPQVSVPGGQRQRFAVGAIYRNFGDVTVWLKGAIYAEYKGSGGVAGPLGLPSSKITKITKITGITGCGGGGCSRVTFDHGRIYLMTGLGAHAIWGRVLSAYLGEGGAGGTLGFPTTRVQVAVDGSASATFQHGSISCPPPGTGDCTIS